MGPVDQALRPEIGKERSFYFRKFRDFDRFSVKNRHFSVSVFRGLALMPDIRST